MTDGSGVPPGGFTALPEIGTVCAPAPSSELIVYTPVKLPATLGVKVIGIWIASSGARTWPSVSGTEAVPLAPVTETVAEAAPAAVGVNVTDADTDWPGVSTVPVAGSPVTANCPPGG